MLKHNKHDRGNAASTEATGWKPMPKLVGHSTSEESKALRNKLFGEYSRNCPAEVYREEGRKDVNRRNRVASQALSLK